jgi:hypothetical protein
VRKILVTAAVAGALLGGGHLTVSAQEGIVIQNNGVDSSQSSAGADNVNISQSNGNSASNNGSGANNEVRTLNREERTRDRKDRSERTSDEVAEAAPEGEWVPEDTGTYDAYAEEGTDWTEPVAAPVEMAAEVQPAPESSGNLPIQLPNTGAGIEEVIPLAAFVAGAFSAACGSLSWRRRLNS